MVNSGHWREAWRAAVFGRDLSELECRLENYDIIIAAIEVGMNTNSFTKSSTDGLGTDDMAELFEMRKKEEDYLCAVFLDAIRKHNGQKILEIAEAVWFLNKKRKEGKPKDFDRAILVFLKSVLDEKRKMEPSGKPNFWKRMPIKRLTTLPMVFLPCGENATKSIFHWSIKKNKPQMSLNFLKRNVPESIKTNSGAVLVTVAVLTTVPRRVRFSSRPPI